MAVAAVLRNRKIAISRPWFDRFRRNLTRWCMLTLLTVLTVKVMKLWKNPGTRFTHDLRTNLRHILWPVQRTLGSSEVYCPAWEIHCNNLRLVLGLGLVRVSSRVRVRIRVKVRVSVMVRVSISTSCYRPVIYTRPEHLWQSYYIS